MASSPARIGIVTVSDRASQGIYIDRGGPEIMAYVKEAILSPWEPVTELVPDEIELLATTLSRLANAECALIITTGGTGPAARDITPEATERVCEKMLPGFGEQMRRASLEKVPTAILSRQTAGICGKSLIVNLPGQPKAIRECLDAIFAAVPYAIDLIGGPYLETAPHIKAFRPKKQ
jgi:molybdopterin adenylyltransferase